MTAPPWSLRRLHALDDPLVDALAEVLIDCVEGGASVSFMHPLTRDRARAFWRKVAQGVAAGERALLVAEDARGVCGTVQLVFDLPENRNPIVEMPCSPVPRLPVREASRGVRRLPVREASRGVPRLPVRDASRGDKRHAATSVTRREA